MADKEVSKELKKVQRAVEKAGDFSAEKLIKYNVKANEVKAKQDELSNQKLIKKQDDAIQAANARLGKKNITDEKRAKEEKTIAEANAKKQEVLLKKGPSDAKIELDATNDLISLMEAEFKETGKSRKDEKKMRALEKKRFQLELKQASPAERAEMIKDQAAKDSRMLTTLQAIGQRIRGNKVEKDGGGDSMFSGPLKFLKGLLIKGAMLAFIMFLPKILDSKFMRDAIDFMQAVVIPQLKKFYEDAIVPLFNFFVEDIIPVLMKVGKFLFEKVLPIITVLLVKQIETFKNFFTDITAAFEKIFSGDILGGITDLILGIGKAILGTIDNIATAIFNTVLSIFGLEGTDSIFGSIAGFFGGLKDKVVGFFTETIPTVFMNVVNKISETFTNIKDSISGFFGDLYDKVFGFVGELNVFKFFEETIGDIIDSVKAIFSGEDIMANLGKLAGALLDIVMYPINVAINFVKDIFGFGNPDEPFRMSEFIAGIFTKIGDFFRNLFDIDIRGLASKFLPKTLVDFVLGKEGEDPESLEAAGESGLYEKKKFGKSKIDTGLVKFAPENQLKAILADDDLAGEDKQMIEKELQKRKLQKDLQKGNLGVAEQIDEFGGTDRAIREAAAREAASTNIVAPDQRVVSNSSTTVVQQETITPTYNGYNLVTTEPDY